MRIHTIILVAPRFNSNYRTIINLIETLLFLTLGLSFFITDAFPFNKKPQPKKVEVKELVLTPEQLEKYASSYKDPYVLHIRKVIDNYMNGKLVGMTITKSSRSWIENI